MVVGMILALIGSAVGQDYQPIRDWTKVDSAAISSFFGKMVIEAAKKYLNKGVKYSKYFVSSVLGSIFGSWMTNKYCYYLQSNNGLGAVLIPAATSLHSCQELAEDCVGAGKDPWGVQYSDRIDFPSVTICHED